MTYDHDVQAADGPRSGGWKQKALLCLPTIFDLAATVLMNVGLLYVTASVYQMMRGAEMLFAALFSVVFLKRSLNRYHYSGILCCVVSHPVFSNHFKPLQGIDLCAEPCANPLQVSKWSCCSDTHKTSCTLSLQCNFSSSTSSEAHDERRMSVYGFLNISLVISDGAYNFFLV